MNAAASKVFVDANVFLYARDGRNAAKQARAEAWISRLWLSGSGCVSWQVLHEFYWNATRKLKLDAGLARGTVQIMAEWMPVETSFGLVEQAWAWTDKARITYWDALIVAAAERCSASYLLTEDLQSGRTFGACRVVNPFTTSPENLLGEPTAG